MFLDQLTIFFSKKNFLTTFLPTYIVKVKPINYITNNIFIALSSLLNPSIGIPPQRAIPLFDKLNYLKVAFLKHIFTL